MENFLIKVMKKETENKNLYEFFGLFVCVLFLFSIENVVSRLWFFVLYFG